MIVTLIIAFLCYGLAKYVVNSNDSNNSLIVPSGNILIFDTETDGFPLNYKASIYETNNWPRIESIAWNKIAPNGQLLSSKYFVKKPNGFSEESTSTTIHGVSNEYVNLIGLSLKEIILLFENELSDCHYLVAHNIEFDYAIVFSEYRRVELNTTRISSIKKICTMKKSITFCKLPSKKGYKYPKLSELYYKLFGISISNEYNSQTNANVCMKCLKELFNLKIIKF